MERNQRIWQAHESNKFTRKSYWNYFIKTTNYGDKRIYIEDEKFSNINEIISTIFQRAKNANFMSITNTSKIPFKENLETTIWNKKDTLKHDVY